MGDERTGEVAEDVEVMTTDDGETEEERKDAGIAPSTDPDTVEVGAADSGAKVAGTVGAPRTKRLIVALDIAKDVAAETDSAFVHCEMGTDSDKVTEPWSSSLTSKFSLVAP